MSATTSVPNLSANAETVIQRLYKASAARDRTKAAIRDACGLNGLKADAALTELLAHELIEEADGAYCLSDQGRSYVQRKREKKAGPTYINNQTNVNQSVGKVENSSVSLGTVRNASAKTAGAKNDFLATPINFNSLYSVAANGDIGIEKTLQTGTLPYLSAQAHPARAGVLPPKRPDNARSGPIPSVRFLLAFSSLRDSLPIPVFDQDKLGRARENQISLPHDVYLSQSHCRFHIKRSKTSNAEELYIEDLGSRNGTLINGGQIEPNKPVLLKHGSRLEIGGLAFVIVEVPY